MPDSSGLERLMQGTGMGWMIIGSSDSVRTVIWKSRYQNCDGSRGYSAVNQSEDPGSSYHGFSKQIRICLCRLVQYCAVLTYSA